ncbi:MAG: glycosyltransferase [Acidobacteriota bacterium]|nr:glycosyltransferase [Acidobacteriota bacterium]
MRVLFLGPASACHVTRWTDFLRSRGHEVLLATMHAIPPRHADGSAPLAPKLSSGPTSMKTLLPAVRAARRLARDFRPEVVCAYYMSSYGFVGALAGLRPLVGAAAGGDVLVDDFDSALKRLRIRAMVGFTLARTSGMLAWAPHVAARLEELGFPREKILVQPRGVDQRLFAYRRPRRRPPGEPLRILSIRWLKPLYRVDTLVEALVGLARAGARFEARIGGEGSEREQLETRVREAGLGEQVRFLGRLEADDIPAQMAWSDVYVSTSSSDGASSSLFEALSVGTYPVVSDIIANRPFIEPGVNGRLFPVGDVAALRGHLLALERDDESRLRGIEAARRLVAEKLDYGRNMERIEAFLAAAAGRGATGGSTR